MPGLITRDVEGVHVIGGAVTLEVGPIYLLVVVQWVISGIFP